MNCLCGKSIKSINLRFRGLANDAALDSILDSKGKHQQDLISDLLADEKYQREAFTAMFVKEDQMHKEICQQVEQIQAELANLTVVEMTKKDLKVSLTTRRAVAPESPKEFDCRNHY